MAGIRPKSSRVRLRPKERLSLFTDLSTMLTAGIPILEAIQDLELDAKGSTKRALAHIRHRITNGEPLSNALETMPLAFDPINVNLIRAAETGGTLEETLHDIVISSKKEIAFNDQLRTTMIYPAFVMVVFLAIVILMLTFVIPRVAKVFTSMRVHIPWVTRVMMDASAYFMQHWIYISIGFIVFLVLLSIIVTANKRLIIRGILSLPVLKVLGNNIDLARFTRSFGLLTRAGVPLLDALDLSQRVVQKKQLAAIIQRMRRDVAAGNPLSTNLRTNRKVIPPLMARSIETAETSGTLEATLQNLTEHFDEEVNASLKVISSLIEPVLLVVVGAMVGTLMVTIIAPIYNLISQINPKSG